jgi:hypothetical protein
MAQVCMGRRCPSCCAPRYPPLCIVLTADPSCSSCGRGSCANNQALLFHGGDQDTPAFERGEDSVPVLLRGVGGEPEPSPIPLKPTSLPQSSRSWLGFRPSSTTRSRELLKLGRKGVPDHCTGRSERRAALQPCWLHGAAWGHPPPRRAEGSSASAAASKGVKGAIRARCELFAHRSTVAVLP